MAPSSVGKTAFKGWKFKDNFVLKDNKGNNVTVQCKFCLPVVKIRSASTSNLEKHSQKAESERRLLEIRTDMMEMNAEHERHLTQTNMKIDTEVAGLKTMLESHKLDTIKYLAGSVFTCLTVVLGFYRIWM